MSYILDALRKADAQRERDASRGIHAQALPAAPARRRSFAAAGLPAFAALAAGILVAAAAGWYVTRASAPAAIPAPAVAVTRPPLAQPRAPEPKIASTIVPSPAPIAPPPVPARLLRSAAPPAAQPAPAAVGLPPDAPKVAISGGVYSPDPAQRMLIVDGQVYNEGSEVAPGVTIDKIETRTAILKFRGARYTVAY